MIIRSKHITLFMLYCLWLLNLLIRFKSDFLKMYFFPKFLILYFMYLNFSETEVMKLCAMFSVIYSSVYFKAINIYKLQKREKESCFYDVLTQKTIMYNYMVNSDIVITLIFVIFIVLYQVLGLHFSLSNER